MNPIASSASLSIEGQLPLSDGRRLAYAEYGARSGYPVFFMHGAPGSRRLIHPDMAIAAERLGMRIIVPDRPGYGGSAPQPGRTFKAWSQDVHALAQALKLNRFSVAGYSMGGVYALACAHDLPDQIDGVAVIGGVGPFDGPDATEGMAPDLAGLFALARSDPGAFKNATLSLAASPAAVLQTMSALMPVCDQAVLRERHQAYLDDVAESLRPGVDGLVADFTMAVRPWGFAPTSIGAQVNWWHGALDRNVPLAMAQRVIMQLPRCSSYLLAQEGHMILPTHWIEILQALMAD